MCRIWWQKVKQKTMFRIWVQQVQKTNFRIWTQQVRKDNVQDMSPKVQIQTHLLKRRRKHRRVVVAVAVAAVVVVVVALVALVAVGTAAARGVGGGGRRPHHHRHHRTLMFASEFAEVCPGYGIKKTSNGKTNKTSDCDIQCMRLYEYIEVVEGFPVGFAKLLHAEIATTIAPYI